MINIDNVEHFHKVLKEVESTELELEEKGTPIDLLGQLETSLQRLNHYGEPDKWEVHLGWDWAQWSFGLSWTYEGEPSFVGGLVFHNGAGMNDGSFSVELNAPAGPHWSVHT